MAKNTNLDLRGQLMYSVFVRNHTKEGTFRALEGDLDRIAALGTDIIWLMPIHPIGVEGKKGSLGCPYANRDYRTVNPEYGTMEDFRALVEEIPTLKGTLGNSKESLKAALDKIALTSEKVELCYVYTFLLKSGDNGSAEYQSLQARGISLGKEEKTKISNPFAFLFSVKPNIYVLLQTGISILATLY